MNALKLLSRDEMKAIMAGYMNPCAADCAELYGGYLQDCIDTYGPASDERAECLDETDNLYSACQNDCQVH